MSTILSEEDLNDFVAPALACTKPTQIVKSKEPVVSNENGGGNASNGLEVQVGIDDGNYGSNTTAEKVTITLSDCLACSGCITSSEELLLQKQSHTVFLQALEADKERRLVVLVAPQARISLADYFGMKLTDFDLCLANFFGSRLNARYVVGTQYGRVLTIRQTIDKLLKLKEGGNPQRSQSLAKCTPRLSTSCPGFVLYTEKTKPELVPSLLNVKSPQQITGSLLRNSVPRGESQYILALMPCFDKKLEALRPDSVGEVDCVITPKEFVSMLQDLKVDFQKYATKDTNILTELSPKGWDPSVHWASNLGMGSSGGLAFQYVEYLRRKNPGSHILTLEGKNSNILEYRLVSGDSDGSNTTTLASASVLSGFRNIQNMVRNLSTSNNIRSGRASVAAKVTRNIRVRPRRKTDENQNEGHKARQSLTAEPFKVDFIEVNASPSGCINGNGMMGGGEESSARRKMHVQKMIDLYTETLPVIDPLTVQLPPDVDETKFYEYSLHAIDGDKPKAKDIVSVGSSW